MTEEELRKKITVTIFDLTLRWDTAIADQILALIREAGYLSPEEVIQAKYEQHLFDRKYEGEPK